MINGASVRVRIYRSTVVAAAAAAALVSSNVGLAATSFAGIGSTPIVSSVTASNASATVNWTPGHKGGQTITGYEIIYTPVPDGTTVTDDTPGISATSATTTGLTNGQEYSVKVEESYSDTTDYTSTGTFDVTPTGAAVPDAPTGVTGTAGASSVLLSWTAGSDNDSTITGYSIAYTDTSGGAGSGSQVPTGTSTSATVTGLVPGDHYTFTVTATNGIGTGATSTASSSVTPYTLPGAPTAVIATGTNGSVGWNRESAEESRLSPMTNRWPAGTV